jgi:hypothetical protein
MVVPIYLSSSRSKRSSQSEAQRQQMLRVESNNLRLLKIILDTENKSISMQNLWAWGGGWLEHTEHVQPVHYIYIYRDQHTELY